MTNKHIPETFAEEITLRLHSTINIEKALYEVLCYLREFLAIDNIHVNIINTRKSYVRYLATATAKEGGIMIDERIAIPKELVDQNFSSIIHGEVSMYNQAASNPVIREILRNQAVSQYADHILKFSGKMSVLSIAFRIGDPLIGFFILVASGENRYNEEDKNILRSIERPLTGAILNLFHLREIQIRNEQLERSNASLHDRLGHLSATRVIGAETGLKKVMRKVRQVAAAESPVLITGETGSGKEVIARSIHELSKRAKGPMLCINCGAIPENLMDSELFGHEKGAFTGAIHLKRGYFEQANGGTIFLDEIAELSPEAQVKLLRVLEEKAFHRVGAGPRISVDIRIIAATNKPLEALAKKNIFREDLWFRLNVFPIHIPPLRERKEDIKLLAEYFAMRSVQEMKLKFTPRFGQGALEDLKRYEWPGNIRELRNVIERSIITSNGAPLYFPWIAPREKISLHELERAKIKEIASFPRLEAIIADHILSAIKLSGGKIDGKKGAAELLGINPSTLRGKMRKLGIVQKKLFKNRRWR